MKKIDAELSRHCNPQSRRRFIQTSLTLSAGVAAAAAFPLIWIPGSRANTPKLGHTVETTHGKIRGLLDNGVNVFKGIPYGAATGGKNRFRPPQPAVGWSGVRDTFSYGATAPQTLTAEGKLPDGHGEDCLVLNIWSPGLGDGAKRPVMFWCHGGGFRSLSGSSTSYDGTNLCNRGDVVVVTVNHRLNAMGFTHLAALGGEEFKHSGTAGMLDIVQALQWVRDNIEAFGGDPDRVMLFGESGGGRKVGTLLAMPAAKGLFHRAAIQSGPSIKLVDEETGTAVAGELLRELGLKPGELRKAQAMPVERVVAAYLNVSRRGGYRATTQGFAPVVDGDSLPQHPFHPGAADVNPAVPVIVGANRTEMTFLLRGDAAAFNLDSAGLRARISRIFGDKAEEVIEVYQQSSPDASSSELFFLIVSDARYVNPCTHIAERRAALGGGPVYHYYLTWQTQTRGGRLMTPHALDIPLVFDNTEPEHTVMDLTTGSAEERALADKVSDTWIEFARTGKPNAGKLPDWPTYNAKQRPTMVIDNNSRVINDPLGARRKIMSAALGLG